MKKNNILISYPKYNTLVGLRDTYFCPSDDLSYVFQNQSKSEDLKIDIDPIDFAFSSGTVCHNFEDGGSVVLPNDKYIYNKTFTTRNELTDYFYYLKEYGDPNVNYGVEGRDDNYRAYSIDDALQDASKLPIDQHGNLITPMRLFSEIPFPDHYPTAFDQILARQQALTNLHAYDKPLSDFSNTQDMAELEKKMAKFKVRISEALNHPPQTCINTATSCYNTDSSSYQVASNVDFTKNPAWFGYRKIDPMLIEPGDIIVFKDESGHPQHATLYEGVAQSDGVGYDAGGVRTWKYNKGDTLLSYSTGGYEPKDLKFNKPLSELMQNFASYDCYRWVGLRR